MGDASVVLSVQTLTGEWADVMQFMGGPISGQLERAAEQAALLSQHVGMPTRITVDWPEED